VSTTAKLIGLLMIAAFLGAAAVPTLTGTLGLAVAGLILMGLFVFVTEDDERRRL
jgi:hypothetical protein